MPDNPFKSHSSPQRNAFAGPSNNPRDGGGLFGMGDMTRNDGTQKGRGYLGPVKNALGQTMTEFSIGVGIDGKEMEIPTMVPTLDPREIQYLRNMREGMPIPPSIKQKAIDHALMRMRQGLPVFHDNGPPQHARRKF